MITILIEGITATLLLSAAIILRLWKKDLKPHNAELIKKMSVGIAVIGLYELSNFIYSLLNLNIPLYSINKIIKLIGLLIILFSLFNYLEVANKKWQPSSTLSSSRNSSQYSPS